MKEQHLCIIKLKKSLPIIWEKIFERKERYRKVGNDLRVAHKKSAAHGYVQIQKSSI